jgi:predicted KAP-like P-loop ATPase
MIVIRHDCGLYFITIPIHNIHRIRVDTSMLYVFTERNCPRLIRRLVNRRIPKNFCDCQRQSNKSERTEQEDLEDFLMRFL